MSKFHTHSTITLLLQNFFTAQMSLMHEREREIERFTAATRAPSNPVPVQSHMKLPDVLVRASPFIYGVEGHSSISEMCKQVIYSPFEHVSPSNPVPVQSQVKLPGALVQLPPLHGDDKHSLTSKQIQYVHK